MIEKMIVVFLFVCQSLFAGIQITENTPSRLSFIWDMDSLTVLDSAQSGAIIAFGNQNVDLGDSGEPALPGFTFYAGVPPQGNSTVQWTPLSTKTITLSHAVRTRYETKYMQRFPDITFSGQWLSQPLPVRFGGIRAKKFILRPVLYNQQAKTLQILTKGRCTIEFPAYPSTAVFPAGGATYQAMLTDLLLNYSIARKWAAAQPASKRLLSQGFPLSPSNTLVSFIVGDGHDSINEATTRENGIVKLSSDTLKKYLGTSLLWNQVTCYASFFGEMPITVPDITGLPDGVSEIPLIKVDANNNGIVDAGDYALIYVIGASDWVDTVINNTHQYVFKLNRYEDYRHYWLALKQTGSSASMTKMTPITAAPTKTLNSFRNHLLYKNPQQLTLGNLEGGGLDWIWAKLSPSVPAFQYILQCPGADTTKKMSLRINKGYMSDPPKYLKIMLDTTTLCIDSQNVAWITDTAGMAHNALLLKLNASNFKSNSGYMELASVEYFYTQKLDMLQTKSMTIFSPETSSIVRYSLSNIPAEPVTILRISSGNQISLIDTINGAATPTYTWVDSAGRGVRYFIAAQSQYQTQPVMNTTILSSGNYMIHDLRSSVSLSSDYLIITPSDFITQAQRLAAHKLNTHRFTNPKIIDVQDIYREFSGGNLDPAAIRNFLVYARANWGTFPDYLVLMGKGTNNYKRIKISDKNYIPAPEFGGWCYENFYTCLDAGENITYSNAVPDLIIGRLPCASTADATQIVDKIVQMEDSASALLGAWKNRVVLVNDDDMQGDIIDGVYHLESSERMGRIIAGLRPAVDMHKINEFEYKWNSVKEKPEARAALVNEINNGEAIINYFGHGSPSQWSDERILTTDIIGTLANKKKYPLFTSFSCSVGHFDRPGTCLSEEFVIASQCGGIASIAATRETGGTPNESFALDFIRTVLDTASRGITFGAAFTKAQALVCDENQKRYAYLGDPSISPAYPLHKISVTAVNSSGIPLDTLKALQTITVRGSVIRSDGLGVEVNYGTTASPCSVVICLFNPPVNDARRKDGITASGNDPRYNLPGTLLFSGQAPVINGVFEQTLYVPKRVTYDSLGAKITAFAWNGFNNGLGYKSIVFHGTDSASGAQDTIGPVIAIRPAYEQNTSIAPTVYAQRTDGITASLPFQLEIDVADSNGIDVSGTGPDEGLTLEVPGAMSKRNINTKFQFAGGNYRKGSATFDFGTDQLPAGIYKLAVSAQDLSGNITKKTYALEIVQEKALTLTHVFNFPNPMKMGQSTTIYFDVSRTTQTTGTVKIYSLSGKLLRVLYNVRSGVVFDGRDQMGNLLGPQVYLFQVIVDDNSGQVLQLKSSIQKLVVHPPR